MFASTKESFAADASDKVDETPPPAEEKDEAADDEATEIERAAQSSLGISGRLSTPCNFGGISYLDTSSLEGSGDVGPSHRVLFVLGGPGAGKGTQSDRIVSSYQCVHLSAGELLRAGAEKPGYPHAALVKKCLVEGNIVPVAVSLDLLRTAMDEKAAEGDDEGDSYGARIFLVDGFPRNYDNLSGWMEHMTGHTSVLGALVYDCPVSVLEQRIMSRAETSGRSDDNLESARRRFATFKKQTEPVVQALQRVEALQEGKGDGGSSLCVDRIDGTGTVDEVWEATRAAMDNHVHDDVLTANAVLLGAVEAGDAKGYARMCEESFLVELKKGSVKDSEEGTDAGVESSTFKMSLSLEEIFETYEGPARERAFSSVANASVKIYDGTKAVVSYDRQMKTLKDSSDSASEDEFVTVREKRAWQHGSQGWRCIHFSRRALE